MPDKEYTFIMEVVERATGKTLIKGETVSYSLTDNSEALRLMQAKLIFVRHIKSKAKHQPRIRNLLSDVDWIVEGVEV